MAEKKPPQPPHVTDKNMAAVLMKTLKTIEACGLGDVFRRELGGEAQLATAANPEEAGDSARAGSRGHGNTFVVPDGVADIEAIDAAGTAAKDKDEDEEKDEPTGSHSATQSQRGGDQNPTSDLRCERCRLDPTVPPREQNKSYYAMELEEYLKSACHSRHAQIIRCFNMTKGKEVPNKARCPMWTCEAFQAGDLWTSEEFVDHLLEKHPRYMDLEE
jgi:hypothetical protein